MAQNLRVARCSLVGLFCEFDQLDYVKTGGKRMDALCRLVPIGIAARPSQEIDLPRQTCGKCQAKLSLQHGVITCCHRKRVVEIGRMVGHCDRQLEQQG